MVANMLEEKEILEDVLKTICKLVWSDGGDGCGLIYCKNKDYKEVSKDFNYYFSKEYKLTEGEDYHLWSDNLNENFFFTSNKQKVIDELNNKNSDWYIITI